MKAHCPFCQKESSLYFRTRDRNRRVTDESFDYYRCPGCRLIFVSPMPADLGKYYQQDYYTTSVSLEQLEACARPEEYKVELIRRFKQGGRLLEIGPAVGCFCLAAKRAGFEVEAIEMSAECCRVLEEKIGVRAINSSDTKGALSQAGPYDVIALWHVIEHLPDPLETMAAAASRLVAGGLLAVAAPNPAAFQFRVLGRYWAHVDAPRHVFLIPAELLIERARSLGLKPLLVTTTDAGGLGWNRFGWEYSLSKLTTRERPSYYLGRVGSKVTDLLARVEQRGMSGSAYTIIFRKEGAQEG